jgi:DNA-binding MarR family transcriptional regulator
MLPFDPVAEARRQWVEHGWEPAADGMAAVTSLFRVQQILLARIEAVLRPYQLSFARYETLMLLHFSRDGALPMSAIGRRLQVHPTSTTSAVDRLERQGFVRRRPHPEDRRAVLASITAAGRRVALAATADLNVKVFADPGISPAVVELLRDF